MFKNVGAKNFSPPFFALIFRLYLSPLSFASIFRLYLSPLSFAPDFIIKYLPSLQNQNQYLCG